MYIGRIDEQALAINVEGKGIVLVVGCGHQTLDKLLTRTAQLFGEPIYGVIGGLHYPVPRGRILTGGSTCRRWSSSARSGVRPSATSQRTLHCLRGGILSGFR